ncbi:MAG: cytochrome c [Verrucomicrobiales bacterium]|jgi:cytochrome c
MKLFALIFLLAAFASNVVAQEAYDPSRFEREILVPASRDALQFEILPNGDIVFAEFWGDVKFWSAETKAVTTLGHIDTFAKGEVGFLGMAVAPDFLESGFIYALFCPEEKQGTMRVSRFTAKDGKMPAESEQLLLEWPYDTEHVFHMGGAMFMDGKGDLYIGNGDNCHWNPGLPIDLRPGRKSWDALRSAGNSRDLRGAILRIHPKAEGGYDIPEGNLFADGKDGAPEIYGMGIRNPFRMTVDDTTGILYFGDVGPNVLPELGIEPAGYEEINATAVAGNFGWPLFIGPNEKYRIFDFEKNEVIETFDPDKPRNPSPNNTGAKDLPPANPALIWYATTPSKEFPTLGSGGRSIMAGPVYHYDQFEGSEIRLPREFDGKLFIYEWMRNWIQTVDLESKGPEITPFLADWNLRRPIDMKLGPDGALYLIEYGDRWWENSDSRITRIVYRRGNRPPAAAITASVTAGKHPLTVEFDASGSSDPDGDPLKFKWRQGEDASLRVNSADFGEIRKLKNTYHEPGTYEVRLVVRDSNGAEDIATQTIHVGNSRPEVRFESPAHGSFFDWGESIGYKIDVSDADSEVAPALTAVNGEFRNRRFLTDEDAELSNPGLTLMRSSTCFACHLSDAPSAGPPYEAVAEKYKDQAGVRDLLAQKVISGGTGAWGELPMPPHPQHSIDESLRMIDWILALAQNAASAPRPGAEGAYAAPDKPTIRVDEGVLVLTAGYTDQGAEGAPALRGEAQVVLHSRRKKAALYDENHGMQYVEQVEAEKGIIGHFEDGDSIIFRELNLDGIKRVIVRAGSLSEATGKLELRIGSPAGKLLAAVEIEPSGDGEFPEIPVELSAAAGLIDLCVVARFEEKGSVLGLNWIEFPKK